MTQEAPVRQKSAGLTVAGRPAKTRAIMAENAPTAPAADVSAMTFEAALEELSGIVRRLEAGQVPLDDAIALFERATALKAHCDARLSAAEARIEQIRVGQDGQAASLTPFDAN